MPRFVELNHPLAEGMPAYPGLPPARFGALFTHEMSRPRYDGKAEFFIGRVEMVGNTGTYLDSPFHRFPNGDDLSRIPLENVAGLEGRALDAKPASGRAVTIECPAEGLKGRAVLIRTGWDRRWGTESYWEPGPFLAAECLDLLVRTRPALVGVDFWNVDDTSDPARPAHTRLLQAGILIVEHLANLSALPPSGFKFCAVPLRVVRGASFPVRAFAQFD